MIHIQVRKRILLKENKIKNKTKKVHQTNIIVSSIVIYYYYYSIIDVGNLQRLSNGPFWSENLAVGWDASIYSFAYNGAVCDNDLFASDTSNAMPSIKDQIEMYYNEQLNLEPNETVYAFWVGLNDMDVAFKQENGTSLWGDIVDCISTQMVKHLVLGILKKRDDMYKSDKRKENDLLILYIF